MKSKVKNDLVGRRFGRLVVLKLAGLDKGKRALWLCKCDCGNEKTLRRASLVGEDIKSCGCLNIDHCLDQAKKNIGRMKVGLEATLHPEIRDIYWAAGVYEGEGNCHGSKNKVQANISQNGTWLLDKLKCLFGGTVSIRTTIKANYWQVSGARARGFLMTLYPLLSPRRQEQIREALKGLE